MGLRTRLSKWLQKPPPPHLAPRIQDPWAAQARVVGAEAEVVFDVGAFDGRSAKAFRKLFPKATIHSFEPTPHTFEDLVANIATDERIHPVNSALAEEKGTLAFDMYRSGQNNSLLPQLGREGERLEPMGTTEVNVDTIDDYCQRKGVEEIDLLKIDTQGADLRVLQGAKRMLEKVRVIFSEVCILPLYEGHAQIDEIYSFLRPYGFQLFDFCDPHYNPGGQLRWCDLLFTKAQ